ncbi:MAG TPA: STAS domain-containing protein [Solirubrobacteraceae bacterium]|jgi:stage II sporulation protein AA (anti-sigma F factor antagonist)
MTGAGGAGDNEAGSLEIKDLASPGGHTVVLDGELDITTAGELQPLVVRLCADGARHLALDLSALTFIDSSGLQAILWAQSVCRDHGTQFLLTSPRETVRRVFEITGMLDVLPFAA